MKAKYKQAKALLVGFLYIFCCTFHLEAKAPKQQKRRMELVTIAFKNNSFIPMKYTCDGDNISPSLNWGHIPTNSKSLAIIMEDPDSPSKTWTHWLIYNIPASDIKLKENIPQNPILINEALQGINDAKTIGYSGPCPPSGMHHYHFKLYALDSKLNIKSGLNKSELLKAMEGHILAEAELIGKYSKKQ